MEEIKFDPKTLEDLKLTSDSIFSIENGWTDVVITEYYVNYRDSLRTEVDKDSSGSVVQIRINKNDREIFICGYYPNGQVKAKLPEKLNGVYDGLARHYYENGRVKSEGQFKEGLMSGEWKNYNRDGHLVSIDNYGIGNDNPIGTTKIK